MSKKQYATARIILKLMEADWHRVICVNVGNFWDPRMDQQFRCGYQTQWQFYEKVNLKAFRLRNGGPPDTRAERYYFKVQL